MRTSLLLLLFLLAPAQAEILKGDVAGISSGDAITIVDETGIQHRVKLVGIDAPQLSEPLGKRSYQSLSDLLDKLPISVEVRGRDNFKRIFGKVMLNGRDVALRQIEAGLALHAASDLQSDEERRRYARTQETARTAKVGVWREQSSLEPAQSAEENAPLHCKEIRNTLQCGDGSVFTHIGSRVYGDDGSVYRKRGDTVYGSDGSSYRQKNGVTYGSDGSVCRQRGRLVTCY